MARLAAPTGEGPTGLHQFPIFKSSVAHPRCNADRITVAKHDTGNDKREMGSRYLDWATPVVKLVLQATYSLPRKTRDAQLCPSIGSETIPM